MVAIHLTGLLIIVGYYLFYANMYFVSYTLSVIHNLYLIWTRGLPMLLDFIYYFVSETLWRIWPYLRIPFYLTLIYLTYAELFLKKENDYNCQAYIDRYPDLKNAFGSDCKNKLTADKAKHHWDNFGQKEGRIANSLDENK